MYVIFVRSEYNFRNLLYSYWIYLHFQMIQISSCHVRFHSIGLLCLACVIWNHEVRKSQIIVFRISYAYFPWNLTRSLKITLHSYLVTKETKMYISKTFWKDIPRISDLWVYQWKWGEIYYWKLFNLRW